MESCLRSETDHWNYMNRGVVFDVGEGSKPGIPESSLPLVGINDPAVRNCLSGTETRQGFGTSSSY